MSNSETAATQPAPTGSAPPQTGAAQMPVQAFAGANAFSPFPSYDPNQIPINALGGAGLPQVQVDANYGYYQQQAPVHQQLQAQQPQDPNRFYQTSNHPSMSDQEWAEYVNSLMRKPAQPTGFDPAALGDANSAATYANVEAYLNGTQQQAGAQAAGQQQSGGQQQLQQQVLQQQNPQQQQLPQQMLQQAGAGGLPQVPPNLLSHQPLPLLLHGQQQQPIPQFGTGFPPQQLTANDYYTYIGHQFSQAPLQQQAWPQNGGGQFPQQLQQPNGQPQQLIDPTKGAVDAEGKLLYSFSQMNFGANGAPNGGNNQNPNEQLVWARAQGGQPLQPSAAHGISQSSGMNLNAVVTQPQQLTQKEFEQQYQQQQQAAAAAAAASQAQQPAQPAGPKKPMSYAAALASKKAAPAAGAAATTAATPTTAATTTTAAATRPAAATAKGAAPAAAATATNTARAAPQSLAAAQVAPTAFVGAMGGQPGFVPLQAGAFAKPAGAVFAGARPAGAPLGGVKPYDQKQGGAGGAAGIPSGAATGAATLTPGEGTVVGTLKMNKKLNQSIAQLLRELSINPPRFDSSPKSARFFVIKSYSADDIHKSIKYGVWASTDSGNKRLDNAWHESGTHGPIYLFFSVNGSGCFCGMAKMESHVDYSKSFGAWNQGDKWNGQFKVRWAFIKNVPNKRMRHIRLANNQNKPVTNSRDTQEIPFDQGKQVLKIFHAFETNVSILDDFDYFDQEEMRRTLEAQVAANQAQAAAAQAAAAAPKPVATTAAAAAPKTAAATAAAPKPTAATATAPAAAKPAATGAAAKK